MTTTSVYEALQQANRPLTLAEITAMLSPGWTWPDVTNEIASGVPGVFSISIVRDTGPTSEVTISFALADSTTTVLYALRLDPDDYPPGTRMETLTYNPKAYAEYPNGRATGTIVDPDTLSQDEWLAIFEQSVIASGPLFIRWDHPGTDYAVTRVDQFSVRRIG